MVSELTELAVGVLWRFLNQPRSDVVSGSSDVVEGVGPVIIVIIFTNPFATNALYGSMGKISTSDRFS